MGPSSPRATILRSATIEGQYLLLCPTASTTLAARQASNISLAWLWRSASGFSQNTCFFAAAAAITCSLCSEWGVASRIASMEGSARIASKSPLNSIPCSVQKERARSRSVSTAREISRRSRPSAALTRLRPQRPSPAMAQLIMMRLRSDPSLRLDPCFLAGRRPADDLAPDEGVELRRRLGCDHDAEFRQSLPGRRLRQKLRAFGVELVDDKGGRVGGCKQAPPDRRLEAGHDFRERRQVRKQFAARR